MAHGNLTGPDRTSCHNIRHRNRPNGTSGFLRSVSWNDRVDRRGRILRGHQGHKDALPITLTKHRSSKSISHRLGAAKRITEAEHDRCMHSRSPNLRRTLHSGTATSSDPTESTNTINYFHSINHYRPIQRPSYTIQRSNHRN